jgi:hypothetical protein
MEKISKFIDQLSSFLAAYKGLLPIIGILLIIANFFVGIFSNGFLAQSALLLHLGIIISILGIMLSWAL